jgi:branched-chain amino acid transport system substrate-binding protein
LSQEKSEGKISRRSYLKYAAGVVAVGVVAAAGYGIYEATKPPTPAQGVKIGVLMNLTGPWASIDEPSWKGIQLAMDETNAQGGLLGSPVTAICIDTKADEGETTAATHRLIEVEKVDAIIGYCDTHWVLTAAPIAQAAGIPFMTPGATQPLIPSRTGAFLACFGDNVQAGAMAEYVTGLGMKKTVIWTDDACDFCVAVCKYFDDAFRHQGGEVVYTDHFVTSDTDFSAQVARLKSRESETDCAYIGGIPDNCGLISKQIREGGVKTPILGEDGFDTELLVKVGGEYAEGVMFTTHASFESPAPEVQKFVADYKAKFGVSPESVFAALGYDAFGLIAQAIKNTNSIDPATIISGLEAIKNYPGVTGSISYSPGQRVAAKSVSIMEVKDGKFNLIKSVTPGYIPPPEVAA